MPSLKGMNNSLTGRALIYTVGNFALGASNFLAAAVFVRMMDTDAYGLSCVYLTWVSLLSQIVGLRADGTIQNANQNFGTDKLRGYCSSTIFLGLLVSLLIIVISIILITPLSKLIGVNGGVWILLLFTSFFLSCSNIRKSYCSSIKNAPGDLIVSLVLAFGQIAFSILFIWGMLFGDSYLDRIYGYSIPTLVVGIAILLFFFIKGHEFVNKRYWKFCLKFSIPMIFNGIAFLLLQQSSRIILNYMGGASDVAVFSFACNIALPISVVVQSLGTAWQPEYYEMKAADKIDEIYTHAIRYTTNVTLIAICLMAISPEILKVMGTQDYYAGLALLPLLIAGYYFQFLYTWPVNCELFHGKTIGIAISTIVSAIVNIVLNVLLIPRFGVLGSALAMFFSYVLLFMLHHLFAKKMLPDYILTLKKIFPFVAIISFSTVLMMALTNYFVVRWLIGCIAGLYLILKIIREKSLI